jgi:hypothetical protein
MLLEDLPHPLLRRKALHARFAKPAAADDEEMKEEQAPVKKPPAKAKRRGKESTSQASS